MRAGYISSFLAILFVFVFLIFPSGTAFSDTPPNTENTQATSSKLIDLDTGYLARIIQSAKEGLILLRDRIRFVGNGEISRAHETIKPAMDKIIQLRMIDFDSEYILFL